jgi:hypothetical protein
MRELRVWVAYQDACKPLDKEPQQLPGIVVYRPVLDSWFLTVAGP